MTRISENQASRQLVSRIIDNKQNVDKYSNEVATGIKVSDPGDSSNSGSISRFRQQLDKVEGYKTVIAETKSFLEYQDNIMNQVSDLLVRVKEVASQAANETNSPVNRQQMAEEIFQIRDHLVSLANSTYQGRFVYGGADDDDPPYDLGAVYTNPATGGAAAQRYVFDNETGTATLRTLSITDDLSVTVNSAGNSLFTTIIQNTEKLGRAMAGYATTGTGPAGPAYVFPTDFQLQTTDIKTAMDALDTARDANILPEQVSLGGRLRRLETAESLLDLSKESGQAVLERLQNADEAEAASALALAQNALSSSYTVTSKILRLSILDYI